MGGCLNCVNSGRGNVSHRSWNAFLGTNDRVTSKKLTRKIEIFLVRGCSFETEELLVYLYVQNADRHAVLIFTAPGNNVWKILHQPSNLVGTWKKKKVAACQKNKSEDSKMLTEKLQMLREFCLGRPSLRHSPCIVQACCLWTGRVLKQHQLSKNQIKALSRCAKGQLEEGLHFFGSDSRNLSWGAQRIPFTWDTLFESQTPGYDSSYAAQHNLSCWTWTNAFFISSTESGIELGLCVCVCFF